MTRQISHLLFINDCILFGESSARGAQTLKSILRESERHSDNVLITTNQQFFIV